MIKRVAYAMLPLLLVISGLCGDASAQRTSSQRGSSGRYNPQFTATDTIYVARGTEFNLHFDQYSFDLFGNIPAVFYALGDSGRTTGYGYRFTPTSDATSVAFDLVTTAYDCNGNGIGSDTVTIKVPPDSVGVNTANYLIIGDSLTDDSDNSRWVVALDSLLTAAGDAPDFTGTQGPEGSNGEGYSGWSYESFAKTNGGLNPFWDTDHVNFQSYITSNSFKTPDYVVIMLGANDTYYKIANSKTKEF